MDTTNGDLMFFFPVRKNLLAALRSPSTPWIQAGWIGSSESLQQSSRGVLQTYCCIALNLTEEKKKFKKWFCKRVWWHRAFPARSMRGRPASHAGTCSPCRPPLPFRERPFVALPAGRGRDFPARRRLPGPGPGSRPGRAGPSRAGRWEPTGARAGTATAGTAPPPRPPPVSEAPGPSRARRGRCSGAAARWGLCGYRGGGHGLGAGPGRLLLCRVWPGEGSAPRGSTGWSAAEEPGSGNKGSQKAASSLGEILQPRFVRWWRAIWQRKWTNWELWCEIGNGSGMKRESRLEYRCCRPCCTGRRKWGWVLRYCHAADTENCAEITFLNPCVSPGREFNVLK